MRRSLSARRAWIEIFVRYQGYENFSVALRKESVDRNGAAAKVYNCDTQVALRKESVDRNDVLAVSALLELIVALRKESVDRNQVAVHFVGLSACRSPQGERG